MATVSANLAAGQESPSTVNRAEDSLSTVLAHGSLDVPTCLRLASQLARTLADLHVAHIIHHDLCAANVLVGVRNGEFGLLDLRMASAGQAAAEPRAGDWAYFSPEQTGRMNRPVDYRSDLYSLGVLLYQMLSGKLPFQANDPLEWAHCHVARLAPPLRELVPAVPQAVADIVTRLLAKLPEERYQSARGVRLDLERCLAQWQACGRIEPFPLGADDVPDHIQIPQRLYGRENEIALLLAAFEHMAATGEAALVALSGYSGVGKSALVGELHHPLINRRAYFISGKFDQYQRDLPYVTLTLAFRELVQQLLAETETRVAGWRHRIQSAVGVNGQLIVDALPQVELIIGKQAAVPALPPTEAQHRFRMVFREFMAVFASNEHPLVLFLDDLQWIDAASLKLIEELLSHADTRYLMVIGAYRDNEVGPAHPLQASVDAVRHSAATVTRLELAPLSLAHLNRLMADALHTPSASCEALTRQIFERTGGNPFFFTQFLGSLREEGLLLHDALHRGWQWDLGKIAAKDFADNVVDLVLGKLRRLPPATQDALQRAACLGNKFDLRRLALVSGQAEEEPALAPALHAGLIVRTNGSAKFLHDRIQQAAYSLLPPAERAGNHLHIGRALLANLTEDELAESLFDVASQFNRGAALLIERDEKARVAQVNLRAGRRAKGAAAYLSACVYLGAGMALLDERDWSDCYELMHTLWLERAECEFLSGHFENAEQLIAKLLQHSVSKSDQALVYRLKVVLHVMKSENPQAVASGLACLRLFGIDMAAHPSREQVQAEYAKVWDNLGARSIESLIDLPMMSDPDMRLAFDVFAVLLPAATFTDHNLRYLTICHMVNLALKHGTSAPSAYGYACFGAVLGPAFQRYADGYRFARLACELVDKHAYVAYQAKVYFPMGLVAVWTQPVTSALEFHRTALRAGVDTGDLAIACYSSQYTPAELLVRGDHLDTIWRESEKNLEFVRKARFRDVADIMVSQHRLIASLRGLAAPEAAALDEAAFEAQLSGQRMPAVAGWYWTVKMQERYLSGDYPAALAAARQAAPLAPDLGHNIKMLDYVYYAALTTAAGYDTVGADEQPAWRERLAAFQARLREWAANYPPTFRDKHALVSAEIARLDGRNEDAIPLYEEAIESAHANGFVQNEAIAYECAALFYRRRGAGTIAGLCLQQARGCYARWGADGKVHQLDERYPQLRTHRDGAPATPAKGEAQLDMLSVTKASQAISGRIVLDEVIDTLMRIMLENAGAHTGCLLLARHEELQLAADAHVEQQAVRVRRHPAHLALPAAILNYVRRSREPVLLMDACAPHAFAADPYFMQGHPKSVLCLPILRQSVLIGILYLENNLVTHAFPPERVAVLELLASQAAISLENAQLYTEVREREARVRRLVESNIIGVFFFSMQSGMRDANDALLRMIGYSREDLQSGKVPKQLSPPAYRPLDERKMAEVRATGKCTPYEKEYVRKDGSVIPVLIGATLFEDSRDHGVAFVLDLTERKQAEAEREARKSAEAANAAKSAFLANMSHELRTPLNGILGYAQILQRDTALGERQRAGVNVIRQSGEHLLTLINDILDLAKIEAGKMELHLADIELGAFVRGIGEIVAMKAAQKELAFVCEQAPDLPRAVRADEKRLRQVLLNLLSNAVKFTDRGQVTLRVCCAAPGRLRFDVADTGVGIAADQLDTIFQPFMQSGDPQRRLGGTGLGLSISRQYVRLMGDEIRIESALGRGSTFWFELEAPAVALETATAAEPVPTGYTGPCRKVLVVDDVADNRLVVADLLTPLGFDVALAADGLEGLERAQRERPHLILMDLAMPVMDGLEATRRLRRLVPFKDVPIIAMSASVSAGDSQQSLDAGMNAFLTKPLDANKLLGLIAALLQLAWTYGPRNEQSSSEPGVDGPIVPPPAPEMEVLHRLAKLGNMHDILSHADYLAGLDERYRPFASQLSKLARNFQSKAILLLVEQFLD